MKIMPTPTLDEMKTRKDFELCFRCDCGKRYERHVHTLPTERADWTFTCECGLVHTIGMHTTEPIDVLLHAAEEIFSRSMDFGTSQPEGVSTIDTEYIKRLKKAWFYVKNQRG